MTLLQIHEPGQTPAPHAADAAPQTLAVGIDLGTTHSVIACSTGQSVTVFGDASGKRMIPSVVTYGNEVVRSIKRHMQDAATPIQTPLGAKTPVEISADILRQMKAIAEAHLKQPISKAVITVPAYFDDAARTATRDAARLAGLEVLRLINEPTAAALAYGLDYTSPNGRGQNGEAILGEGKEADFISPHPNPLTREKDTGVSFSRAQSPKGEGIYAIYDLGGGTFDVSILRFEGGVFQVLSTGGDTQLGGDDFDALLAQHLGVDAMVARKVKELLSSQSSCDWPMANAQNDEVTREAFEALIAPLVAKSIHICERALADAKLQKSAINGVVLVGGSTRVPLVRHEVEAFFAQPPLASIDPDEVVAVGAAIQAEALTVGADHLLLDVIPLSLGLETMGGIVDKLIERNTPIPVSVSQTFTTYQDGQTAMKIHVVQGEREMAADNRSLAEFELRGIPPLAANVARIEVTFAVDADGLLTVSAQESTTQTQQRIEVKPSYGLPLEAMANMLRDAMEHAQEDITQRLLIEVRVEAERLLYDLEQAMRKDRDLLDEQQTNQLYAQISNLRSAIGTDNREEIDAHMHRLNLLANDFAEKRMDKAISAALQGSHIDAVNA